MEIASKEIDISNAILNLIQSECGCDFPASQISQTNFSCSERNINHVMVRSLILTDTLTAFNLNVSQLISILNNWPDTQCSLTVHGETLIINYPCFLVTSSFSNSNCPSVASLGTPPLARDSIITTSNRMDTSPTRDIKVLIYAPIAAICFFLILFLVVCFIVSDKIYFNR